MVGPKIDLVDFITSFMLPSWIIFLLKISARIVRGEGNDTRSVEVPLTWEWIKIEM